MKSNEYVETEHHKLRNFDNLLIFSCIKKKKQY